MFGASNLQYGGVNNPENCFGKHSSASSFDSVNTFIRQK